MNNHYKNLWCEKYRPQKFEDLVLEQEIKNAIVEMERISFFMIFF